ncbi:hypothetical protein CERSUDRAFT_115312 [Gelatoporia subvermispora B]|uniref:Uncharacterized protein n=1 Tax=Ceriporiopsis subvermispora (strain B) TaxID=914234 RepID=M2QH29_CERS8|nr:hypothetical protein CERSUDRAFT_115312 [Gelatoporia subvermispora B]
MNDFRPTPRPTGRASCCCPSQSQVHGRSVSHAARRRMRTSPCTRIILCQAFTIGVQRLTVHRLGA